MRAANNNGITIAAGRRRDAGWAGNVLQAMRDPPLMQASARAAPDRTRSANRSIGRCSGRFWLALGPGLRSHTLASARTRSWRFVIYTISALRSQWQSRVVVAAWGRP